MKSLAFSTVFYQQFAFQLHRADNAGSVSPFTW